MLLEVGRPFGDVLTVERLIGEGAFAEVYRVRHRFLGRQALKILKAPGASQDEVDKMLEEAVLLSCIGHPNIIRVFDAGTVETDAGTRTYFTMEYVPGGDLATFWRAHGRRFVSVADAVEISTQMCRALSVAHAQSPPIIHRDIKPQNVLVGYDPTGLRVRLSDWGLAKTVDRRTLLASARGTIGFKPPEFLSGTDSPAADVWAVGAVLHLLLTDRLPFPDLLKLGRAGAAAPSPLTPPSRFNVLVDQPLAAIVERAVAYRAADRYGNAGEMLAALMSWPSAAEKTERPSAAPQPDAVGPGRSPTGKSALGSLTGKPEPAPETLVKQALKLARSPEWLTEAADMLERAVNLKPDLRAKHEYRLRLWRRGITL